MSFSLNASAPTAPELDSGTALLIDADYWTYQLSSCLQHRDVQPDKSTVTAENEDGELFHMESIDALHQLIDSQIRGLQEVFRSDLMYVYLQGNNNFRDDVAVTKPYKGERKKAKPIYYQESRDYLKARYNAVVIDGYETDDQVCMDQMEFMSNGVPSVIVSPDKDLKNMFGYNYNPRTKVLTFITADAAFRHFWEQMVIGDNSVDNIPGVHRVGAAWVKKHDHLNNFEFRDQVIDLYLQKHNYDYMIEQGNLLHMCRTVEEIGEWDEDYDYWRGYEELKPIIYYPEEET